MKNPKSKLINWIAPTLMKNAPNNSNNNNTTTNNDDDDKDDKLLLRKACRMAVY